MDSFPNTPPPALVKTCLNKSQILQRQFSLQSIQSVDTTYVLSPPDSSIYSSVIIEDQSDSSVDDESVFTDYSVRSCEFEERKKNRHFSVILDGAHDLEYYSNPKSQNDHDKVFGYWFFRIGFLVLPCWWIGSIYMPKNPQDQDFLYRKFCRTASSISFAALIATAVIGSIFYSWSANKM